ncbi:MAG: hypothetical protein ACLSB9_20780 [Hydrogeniiclostridium mannosilyticum]
MSKSFRKRVIGWDEAPLRKLAAAQQDRDGSSTRPAELTLRKLAVHLCLNQERIVTICKEESPHDDSGNGTSRQECPAYATAMGQAILAFCLKSARRFTEPLHL